MTPGAGGLGAGISETSTPGRSSHVILFQYTKKIRFPARLGHLSKFVGLKIEVDIAQGMAMRYGCHSMVSRTGA